jgi:hypothetical protein
METLGLLRRAAGSAVTLARQAAAERAFAPASPELPPADAALLAALRAEGCVRTTLADLALPGTDGFRAAAERAAAALSEAVPCDLGYEGENALARNLAFATTARIAPALVRFGLNERLLDLAEHYVCLPVAFLGVDVRRDAPRAPARGSRRWHRDREDLREMKVLVYLSDVDESSLAFEYASLAGTPLTLPSLLDDEEMERRIPREFWRSCFGPRETVLVAATSRVLHRGRSATSTPQRERTLAVFTYTSAAPLDRARCRGHFDDAARAVIEPGLTPRQRAALYWDEA